MSFSDLTGGAGADESDPLAAREREAMERVAAAPAGLRVYLSTQDGTAVVEPEGELDVASAPAFAERLEAAISGGARTVVVDLSRTTYLDSVGLGLLMRAARRLPDGVAVVSPRTRITRLFQATGLAETLKVRGTRDEALRALAERRSQ